MASVNKVILVGNLGREPETRFTAEGGTPICRIAVATSRRYNDKQGQLQEETEWHNVVYFGKQAEIVQTYLHKGSSVYVEGRLRTRKYTGKDGVERYSTEIIGETVQFLGGRSQNPVGGSDDSFESAPRAPRASAPAAPAAPRAARSTPAAQPQAPAAGGIDSLNDDDIPF